MALLRTSRTGWRVLAASSEHSDPLAITTMLLDHLSPGATFLDVGAHFGYFSLLASALVGQRIGLGRGACERQSI